MSQHSSSGAEKVLGMLFTAICFAGLIAYRLYKQYASQSQQKGSQE